MRSVLVVVAYVALMLLANVLLEGAAFWTATFLLSLGMAAALGWVYKSRLT